MIITFYSYKGGVGRTQLVANLASYFCYYEKKRVLLIDWDLEAPGLHFYFDKLNKDINAKGLIDVFQQYVKLRRSGAQVKDKHELPKFTSENIMKLDNAPKENLGCIDLIPAGNYSEIDNYRFNVIDFNWYEFYELLDGKRYIEFIKKELKSLNYDYILVDSRTGLSDYSDICNIQIPDMNVVVMAPTNQNFEGCRALVDNILNSPYTQQKFRKPIILPILSRLDLSIENQSNKWIDKFHNFNDLLEFAQPYFYSKINSLDFDSYVYETLLDYKRDLSYGEQILFTKNTEERTYPGTLKEKYLNVASYIKYFNSDELLKPYITPTKKEDLIFKLEEAKSLLKKWMDSKKNTINTADKKRCEIEIERIQKLIELYETELKNLDNKE